MSAEDPAVAIARVETRIGGLEDQVAAMRAEMATKEGQAGAMELIVRIEKALAAEVEARIKADAEEKAAREKGDSDEKAAREKVAERLQLVEDRLESRKYATLAAIILGAVGVVFGVIQGLVSGFFTGGTP